MVVGPLLLNPCATIGRLTESWLSVEATLVLPVFPARNPPPPQYAWVWYRRDPYLSNRDLITPTVSESRASGVTGPTDMGSHMFVYYHFLSVLLVLPLSSPFYYLSLRALCPLLAVIATTPKLRSLYYVRMLPSRPLVGISCRLSISDGRYLCPLLPSMISYSTYVVAKREPVDDSSSLGPMVLQIVLSIPLCRFTVNAGHLHLTDPFLSRYFNNRRKKLHRGMVSGALKVCHIPGD